MLMEQFGLGRAVCKLQALCIWCLIPGSWDEVGVVHIGLVWRAGLQALIFALQRGGGEKAAKHLLWKKFLNSGLKQFGLFPCQTLVEMDFGGSKRRPSQKTVFIAEHNN